LAAEFEAVALIVHRRPVVAATHRGFARGAKHRVGEFLSPQGQAVFS
jgi:hypothetical protein